MNFRKFGNTELIVSEIGFGAWAIGGGAMIGNTPIGWGDANDKTSKEAIYKSLEAGINFFDTADIYGLGHSEELIGNTIGARKDVVIASKAGNVSRNGAFTTDYSKEHILKACEASLKRLKRAAIDFYQLHSARLADLQKGECIEAMQQLKQEGKIRYWGLSLPTFDPASEAEYLLNRQLGSGFQLVLNIINRVSVPLMKDANAAGYGIIARMPLQFGLLSGKFGSQTSFPDNDHRKRRLPKEIIEEYSVVINTTPVGMFPSENDYPQLPYQYISSRHYFFDLIYNPEKTLLLAKAEERGATIENGEKMLRIQAEESWKIWNS